MKLFKDKLNFYLFLYLTIAYGLSLSICLILSIVFKQFNILYGCLINLFPTIVGYILNVFLFKESTNSSLNQSKGLSILFYSLKSLIVIVGFIIGIAINLLFNAQIFNLYSLCLCALIFPIVNIIAFIHYASAQKKLNKKQVTKN